MPLTRSQKLNLDKKKEDKSDDISKNPAQKEKTKKYFKWKTSEKLVLLDSMIRLKPVGLHKHLNMLLIRERIRNKLGSKFIPTDAVWSYINLYWDIDLADKIEKNAIELMKEDFNLPDNEEWTQLINEQRKILIENETNKSNFTISE